MEAAAAFLAARARSVDETTRRLIHNGYPVALVEDVVTRLIEMGYLDDEAFAREWVASRDRSRPRGETGLRRELALKGVPRDIVDRAIAERGDGSGGAPADLAAARALLGKRHHTLERETDEQKRRGKAYALLARNGFGPDACREAVNAEFARS